MSGTFFLVKSTILGLVILKNLKENMLSQKRKEAPSLDEEFYNENHGPKRRKKSVVVFKTSDGQKREIPLNKLKKHASTSEYIKAFLLGIDESEEKPDES
jgi:hypothetical protein